MTCLPLISIRFVSFKNSSSNRGSLYLCTICRKLTDTHNIDRPNPMMKGFGLSMFIFLVVAIPIAPTPTIIKLRNLPAHNLVTFKTKFN